MRTFFVWILLSAGCLKAAVVTSFDGESLPAEVVFDIPRPTLGNVVFDAVNDELDFTASGNTDMWTTRSNAAIAWTAIPAGLNPGDTWVVETEVRINNVTQNGQVAGLTFYGGPDGSRPDISFGLDNWDPAARAVRLQGLGDNDPNTAVATKASTVQLRVEITEDGAADTYNFFFRETSNDSWTRIPGAAVDYRTAFANSRVGLTYKTSGTKAGAAFTSLHVVSASSHPPILTSSPVSTSAVDGGLARFRLGEIGASSIQWRRDGAPLPTGGNRADLVLDPVTLADNGAVFDCVLGNASGSTTSEPVTLAVSLRSPGGAWYQSAVTAEPSLFAWFPVDGSPSGGVTNRRRPGQSGLWRGPAVAESHPARTVGTQSVTTNGGGWVAVAADPSYEFPDGTGTIEMFAYHSAASSYNPGLISVRTATATRYTLKADAAGAKIHVTNGGQTQSWALPTSSIGRLMHLVLVFDNGLATLHHDGISLGSLPLAPGTAKGGGLTLGSTGPEGQDSFPGAIDEVAFYDDPLPALAIEAHHTAWTSQPPGVPPVFTAQPASRTVDEGGTAAFSVVLADATNARYRWQRNGVDVPGAEGPALTVAPVTLSDQGAQFRCIVYNRHGGGLSEAAVLTVNDLTAPRLLEAGTPLFATQVVLTFDEPVSSEGAIFEVTGGTVASVLDGPMPGQLSLRVTGLTPGESATVTATNVRDLAGNRLTAESRVFTAAPAPVPAPITLVRPSAEPAGPATRRGPFVISEIHYHPRDRTDGRNLEFLEVGNTQPWAEDVSGFRLTGEVSFTFPNGTTIPAGGRLVVAAVPADVAAVYGLAGVFGPWTGALANNGGPIRLRDISEAVVFEVDYDAGPPWPAAADGTGHSLVLARPSFGMNDPRAWDASVALDGSPGAEEPFLDDPYRSVMINEIAAAAVTGDFIELFNYGAAAVDLSGCSLSDDRDAGKYTMPAGTLIGPGQWLGLESSVLGFGLKAGGDTVYFRAPVNPDGSAGRVLDAVRFGPQRPGSTHGRSPDGAATFSALAPATLGSANADPALKLAVISEINYNPPVGSPHPPFVEVANASGAPLDVSGWRLRGGIEYDFPAGTTLAAGAHVAISTFSGRLNTGAGERVRLEQPVFTMEEPGVAGVDYAVVDEVTYRTGGRWGRWSDGGGSSLERIDNRADGRLAPAWADSDESADAAWVTVEATGPLSQGSGSPSNRLHVMLLGAGECLLDDVQVITAAGTNAVANGGFESGTTGWLLQGTHDASSVTSPGFAGNNALHVRAAGRGDLAGNKLTVPLTTTLSVGTTVTLRARVRWLHGRPELLLRLQGGTLEAAAAILPPGATPGTPGAPNSRAVANAGPAITAVTHLPVLPQAGEVATVFARLDDPDGLALARLEYRLDPSVSRVSVPMVSRGAGIFSAQIPAQSSGTLAAFTITAHDTRAAAATYPAAGGEALIRWGEPTPTGTLGTYRLWMTAATRNTWTSRLKNSNTPLDVTFLYGNSRVIHNAGAQYSGSPWHTGAFTGPTGGPCDYDCTLPSDDRLLGETDFLFAGPGTFGDDTSFIREQTIWWMARRIGLPSLHRRFCRVYINGVRRQTVFEDTQQPNGEWIDTYWPGDDNGRLHKAQDWIEYEDDGATFQTTLRALMQKRSRDGGGHDVAAYRFQWAPRSVAGAVNDWSAFTALVDAFNTGASGTDPAFFNALDPLIDEDSWARALAIQRISGNWDTWGWRFGKNMYAYKPERGPWAMTAWDIDFSFGLVGEAANFSLFDDTQDPLCTKFRNQPAFRRAYWRAFREAVDGPMLGTAVNARIDAMVAGLAANGVSATASQVSAVKSYISSRRSYILGQLNSAFNAVAFAPTGGSTLTDDDGVLALTGTAPPSVMALRVNGAVLTPVWTSQSAWRLPVTLYAADNALTVEALDRRGAVVGGFPLTVTVTGPPTRPPVTINEWMADNNAGAGVLDPADGQPDDWFELHNAGDTALDLGGFFLTDAPDLPNPIAIPAGTVIPAHGHLLVWADDSPEQTGLTPGQLHVPFKLSANGDRLRLLAPGGAVIDDVSFGPQAEGWSEGRYPDGGSSLVFPVPTPGRRNALSPQALTLEDAGEATLPLVFTTEPTHVYQIETSTDLASWSPWGQPVTATASTLTVQLPRLPTPRFWRARMVRP